MKKTMALFICLALMSMSAIPGLFPPSGPAAAAYAPPAEISSSAEPSPEIEENSTQGPPIAGTTLPEGEQSPTCQATDSGPDLRLQRAVADDAGTQPAPEEDRAQSAGERQGQIVGLDESVRPLAYQLPQGHWQAHTPSAEGLSLRQADEVLETFVPVDARQQIQDVVQASSSIPSSKYRPPGAPLLLSDGQFVNGPNVGGFDVAAYLRDTESPLADYAHVLNFWCAYRSVNPRVVLALVELRSGLVSRNHDGDLQRPIGYAEQGVEYQIEYLLTELTTAFYGHLYSYGARRSDPSPPSDFIAFTLADGNLVSLPASVTSGTYAVAAAMAPLSDLSEWEQLFSSENHGFVQTYRSLFADSLPTDTSNQITPLAVPPGDLLQFPFPVGATWWFNGPHNWLGDGTEYGRPFSSMDFGTSANSCSAPPSGDWAVAAAGGSGYHPSGYSCWYRIDHGGGWMTSYYHLLNVRGDGGINRNDGVGTIACETCAGGDSTTPHVHFSLLYNGAYAELDGTRLSGWTVHEGNGGYGSGYIERDGQIKYPYDSVYNDGIPSGTDTTPPDGDYTSPANGATITTRTVHMAAWATDNSSGVRWVRFNAKWDGEWRTVHEDSSSPYEFEWDLCDFGVPDGDVELSLHIQDNAGNDFYLSDKHANPHITKNYDDCSSPPPTGDWNARYDQGSTLWWDPNAQITPRCTETITGPELHKDWGAAAPCGGMDGDDWVGDFQATLNFSPGNYVFLLDHDDGVKLWLNGQNIQERSGSGSGPVCPPRYLSGDHQLRLILREEGGDARIHLTWTNNTSVCMPDAPSLLSPADGSTFNEAQGITLSWTATGDEYYGEVWGGPGGTTPFGWQTGTSQPYESLWAGYTYSWHVKARNSVGESGWSSTRTFTVRPATPSNLAAEAVSCGEVNLSWTDNSGSEEGYKIYRNGSYLAQVGANVTSYQDTGLTGSTTYSYYVKAYRGSIESAASNTADATTPACACPTITDWQGEYWSNPDLSGSRVLCRNDFSLDFDWAYDSPDPALPEDGFSARWTRDWDFPAGTYRFHMLHDDGARLYIDDVLRLDRWGTCCAWATVDVVLTGGTHTIRMEMYENTGAAAADLWWEQLDISGWRGEYYNNDALSDHPILVRDDKYIDFEWYENSPDPLVQQDHFSARWTRSFWFASGTYQFDIFHDDGARLYVAGDIVFENWCDDCRQWESVTVPISEGPHSIRLEVFENSGWAAAKLSWEPLILPPAGPTALSATTVSESQIDLHWVDNADNEDGFRIERSLAETTGFTPIATVDADVNGYSDTGLSPDTTYYYRVYAFNTAGDSAYAAAHATTSSPPPAAPTALVATAVSESQIDLHWVDNAGNEAGFRIERSLYGTTGFSPIATLDADATAYSDIGLSPGTTYYYRVYAFNSTGDSAYVSASATTSSPPDPPLANFSGSPTSGEAPLPVSFTDLSLGDIDQWVWSFGDGGTSTARNPGHIYTVAGDYSVSLTVTGPAGSDTKTSTNYIHVSNPTVRVFLPLVMKRQVPPIPEDPVINGDFEDGPWVGWSEYSYQNYPIVMHEDLLYITPHSGSWIAWLGGARDETAYIEQAVVVPTGRSYLHFWQWRASAAPDCGADDALLLVNGRPVLNYDLCSLTNTGTWVETVVDLSTYAGQLVQLRFIAETVESVGSWYVDDVSFKVSADVADVSLSARPDPDLPLTRAVKPAPGTPQP